MKMLADITITTEVLDIVTVTVLSILLGFILGVGTKITKKQ
jgi:hypothetical protein